MNVAQLIERKRDGHRLADAEIRFLIDGYTAGHIPDYQMSALAMAIYFQGMELEETVCLTRCMVESGETLQWPDDLPTVDKHSTGGIGDKVSLVLAPLVACCGLRVPMISGRGLGITGGTLDKLDSIAGFRSEMSTSEMRSVVNWNQCVIVGASATLAPADRKLYALRDVTGTVPSIPLITASILSKKIAEGIDSLVLDVKCGDGAFMQQIEQARELASSLVTVGQQLGLETRALITNMDRPLGRMIGNTLEVNEAISVLQGQGPEDVLELTLELGAELLTMTATSPDRTAALQEMRRQLQSGAAYQRFEEMVAGQGGDLQAPRRLSIPRDIRAPREGWLQKIHARRLGRALIEMGGGRKEIGQTINHDTGIECLVSPGQAVAAGQPLARVYCESDAQEYACELVSASFVIADEPPAVAALILERMS